MAQDTAADQSANTAEAHLGKGYEALKLDRYEIAASEFRAALQLDPGLVLKARFPLAVALFEMHKFDEARQEFEALKREVGDHANVLYYLGRIDLEGGDYKSAILNLTKASAKPPFPDTAYYLGYAYAKQGDLAAAEKWLQEAVRLNPQDARMEYQLGVVLRKQGREPEAKDALDLSERLRRKDAEQSRLRLECAQKLDQGSREEAHAVCDQLYDPDSLENLTSLGTLYAQHGDLESALKPLQRAAELAPQSPQTQYNLALTYFQLNRLAEAQAPLARAVQRWPDLFQLNALYGAILLKAGNLPKAYETLRHAHELNPEDISTTDLLYRLTLDLAQKGQDGQRYSDSLRYYQAAEKLRPKAAEPHRGLAEAYARTGHPAQAKAEQEEAERLSANPSPVR